MNSKEKPVWPERGALERPEITPEVLEAAMRRGRKLRSQHAATLFAGAIALARAALGRLQEGASRQRDGRSEGLRRAP